VFIFKKIGQFQNGKRKQKRKKKTKENPQ